MAYTSATAAESLIFRYVNCDNTLTVVTSFQSTKSGSATATGLMQRFHWLYLVATVPFLLFASWGVEHGAFWIYLASAVACIAQFVVPTRFGWSVVTGLYASALAYTWVLATRLWRIFTDETSVLFLDPEEAREFFAMLATAYAILAALVALSPWSQKAQEQQP